MVLDGMLGILGMLEMVGTGENGRVVSLEQTGQEGRWRKRGRILAGQPGAAGDPLVLSDQGRRDWARHETAWIPCGVLVLLVITAE